MAPNVTVSFWAANDINGTPLLTIDDEDTFFKSLTLKPDLYAVGGWQLTLARAWGFQLFGSGAVDAEVFVRFLVHAYSDSTWYFGGVLNKRDIIVVNRDEIGAEELVLGGSGPKAYMDRSALGIEQRTGLGFNLDLENGVWRWNEAASAGRVLDTVVDEDAARSNPSLPDLTSNFDDTNDSDGNPWTNEVTSGPAEYETPIGSSLLDVIWDLEDLADLTTTVHLGTVATPKYELNAFQSFGDDVSGSSFGPGVGLLREGVNIANDSLHVEGVAVRKASHVIVEGMAGVWVTEVRPSWSPGDYVKWDKIEHTRSKSETILHRAGLRWLQRQNNGDQQITCEIVPGADPDNGYYFPAPNDPIWLGNTIALDTVADGSVHSPLDYNNADQLVTGLELVLGPAGDRTTDEKAAKSWMVRVLLNMERAGFPGSPNQTSATTPGHGGGRCCIPHPPACTPFPPDAVETPISSTADQPGEWPGTTVTSGSCWGGANHESMGGSGGQSDLFTVAPGDLVYGRIWLKNETGNDSWENVDNYAYTAWLQFESPTLPDVQYEIVHSLYHNMGCIDVSPDTVQEVPTGYNGARIVFRFRLGGWAYQAELGTLTTTEGIECPDFSTGEDVPMDSPYTYPSDAIDYLIETHTHPQGLIEDDQTLETDTSLRLAPDGGGGVEWAAGGGGGAPTTANYLVGTADAGLSAEIVVGTTPGGELGNTWASPTVDTTHSGSSHAGVISTHEAASDPHTGYRLESADHSHASTGLQGGTIAHSALTSVTANQHHNEDHASRHADGGADQVNVTGLDGFPGGTSSFLRADGTFAIPGAGGVTGNLAVIPKTSDEIVNNSTTLQDDNQLLYAMAATGEWEFEINVWYMANSAADMKLTMTVPTGGSFYLTNTGDGITGINNDAPVVVSSASTVGSSGQGVATIRHTRLKGYARTTGTAGNLQLQWAQNTAHASDLTVLRGSAMKVFPLS